MIQGFLDMLARRMASMSSRVHGRLVRHRLRRCGARFRPAWPIVIRGGANIDIGDGFTSMGATYLYANEGRLMIGRNVSVNTNVQFGAAGGEIVVGDNVLIGPNVVIRAADHRFEPGKAIRDQGHIGGRIEIGNDVWIAANAVILRGTRLGEGCVIAAGAVVNRDVEPNEIVGGVPARTIGRRGQNRLP